MLKQKQSIGNQQPVKDFYMNYQAFVCLAAGLLTHLEHAVCFLPQAHEGSPSTHTTPGRVSGTDRGRFSAAASRASSMLAALQTYRPGS
jgi:hypothetical protein